MSKPQAGDSLIVLKPTLENGESMKCFICEPYTVAPAQEITHFAGWRKYLESL